MWGWFPTYSIPLQNRSCSRGSPPGKCDLPAVVTVILVIFTRLIHSSGQQIVLQSFSCWRSVSGKSRIQSQSQTNSDNRSCPFWSVRSKEGRKLMKKTPAIILIAVSSKLRLLSEKNFIWKGDFDFVWFLLASLCFYSQFICSTNQDIIILIRELCPHLHWFR